MKNREKKRSTALFYVYENDLCQQIAFRRRVIRSSVRSKERKRVSTDVLSWYPRIYEDIFEIGKTRNIETYSMLRQV